MTALAVTGLALAGIPAGTGAPASPVVVALAWLAAVAVVVLLFGAVCAIAACLLSSRTSQAEEAHGPSRGPAPVGAERAPVVPVAPPISRSHPVTLARMPDGAVWRIPLNPIGPTVLSADVRTYS